MSAPTYTANPVTQADYERITVEAGKRAARSPWFIPDDPEMRATILRQNLIDHHRCGHLSLREFKDCICGPWVVTQ